MDGSCVYEGRRIAYRVHGTGPKVIVLTHGLLMDGRMYAKLAPMLVARGYRLVTIDVLGHGFSDQPHDMASYSMTQFGRDVVAVLDHLGIDRAVIGGTSLGANISLEVAVAAPHRVRGLVLEMPVLENGLAAAAAAFVPLALALRVSLPAMRVVSSLMRRIPRTTFMVDLMLDFVRRDPAASLAVLDGVTFGRVAPPASERRRIQHPTLLVGHRRDPIHPFDDADVLTRDLPRARLVEARSIVEWRLSPARLDDELCAFLEEVFASEAGEAEHTHAA